MSTGWQVGHKVGGRCTALPPTLCLSKAKGTMHKQTSPGRQAGWAATVPDQQTPAAATVTTTTGWVSGRQQGQGAGRTATDTTAMSHKNAPKFGSSNHPPNGTWVQGNGEWGKVSVSNARNRNATKRQEELPVQTKARLGRLKGEKNKPQRPPPRRITWQRAAG